jgi:CspA family cold shock protein
MTKGKIKWYNKDKGYGFIESYDGDDIFMHRTGFISMQEDWQPEQEVEFETKQGDKGLFAANVKTVR